MPVDFELVPCLPPRLCGLKAYCSALRAGSRPGPLCPYCAHIMELVERFPVVKR